MEVCGSTYNCYVYYDCKRAEDERATIHTKVQLMINEAMNRRRFSKKLQESFAPYPGWKTSEVRRKCDDQLP